MFFDPRPGFLILVCLLCLVEAVAAAPGGGIDGGGGGGDMLPQREQTQKLTQIWKDGVALLAEGDCKRAEKKFEDILEKVPRNSEANTLRGIALQCQKKYNTAIQYFKRAKRDDSQFYLAYEKLGISYLALARPDYAEEQLEELAAIKKLCEIRNRRCPPQLLTSHQNLAEAIKRFAGTPIDSKKDDQHS